MLNDKLIEGVVANITGVINEDWRYTKWEESLTIKLKHRLNPVKLEQAFHETNIYQNDLQLLIKNGQTYLCLPEK